jgi:MFS family permease
MLQTFGIVAMANAAYNLTFTYVVEHRASRHDASAFLLANTESLVVVLFAKPLGGWMSDRTGRRRLMLSLPILTMALVNPAMRLMMDGTPWQFVFGQVLRPCRSGWRSVFKVRWSSRSSRCDPWSPR